MEYRYIILYLTIKEFLRSNNKNGALPEQVFRYI